MLDEVDGDDSDGEGTKSIDVSSVGLFLESVSPVLEGHFLVRKQSSSAADRFLHFFRSQQHLTDQVGV